MYSVDLYRRVRRVCHVEGMSIREAARVFGLHRETVSKMLRFSVPPGYRRSEPVCRPKLDALSSSGANLSNRAYTAISEMIHSRRLRGGEVIIEARLAELLGVSRTPLREALQRLEGEGLVTKHANRSFMVRQVDLSEYLQSLKVREILEAEALTNAFGRIDETELRAAQEEIEELARLSNVHTDAHWRSDDRIHDLFANACGNPVMARMIKELRVTTRLFEIARLAERVEADHVEHKSILDAVQEGDVRKARRAMQSHIRSLARHAVNNLG